MEGTRENFDELISDFKTAVQNAKYIAVDCELTGTRLEGSPDSYTEDAETRLRKLCDIAEQHTLTQIGLTVAKDDASGSGILFTTYTVLCFPGDDDRQFSCQPAALRFLREHGLDLNRWVDSGVRYMSREALERKHGPLNEHDLPAESGLFRLWQALLAAKLPLIFHGPLDLFFLLSAFERRRLPRDPKEFSNFVKHHVNCFYDTALLHMAVPELQAKPQKLEELFYSARQSHQLRHARHPLGAGLEERTKRQYGRALAGEDASMAHEAGFDSLLTAMLFAYLWALTGNDGVRSFADRLFLFRSSECLDLASAARGQSLGANCFDDLGGTVLVGTLQSPDAQDPTIEMIARAGHDRYFYRKMDETHLLVFVRGSSDAEAIKHAEDLGLWTTQHGVHWQGLDQWQREVVYRNRRPSAGAGQTGHPAIAGGAAASMPASQPRSPQLVSDQAAAAAGAAPGHGPDAAPAPAGRRRGKGADGKGADGKGDGKGLTTRQARRQQQQQLQQQTPPAPAPAPPAAAARQGGGPAAKPLTPQAQAVHAAIWSQWYAARGVAAAAAAQMMPAGMPVPGAAIPAHLMPMGGLPPAGGIPALAVLPANGTGPAGGMVFPGMAAMPPFPAGGYWVASQAGVPEAVQLLPAANGQGAAEEDMSTAVTAGGDGGSVRSVGSSSAASGEAAGHPAAAPPARGAVVYQ